MGFGNVVAADSVLRTDYPEDNMLIVGTQPTARTVPFVRRAYPKLRRIVENNIAYIANLAALEEWYAHVRRPFFESQEFGRLVFEGLLDKLALAKKERLKRLQALAGKVKAPPGGGGETAPENAFRNAFAGKYSELETLFAFPRRDGAAEKYRNEFLSASDKARSAGGANYIDVIRGLPVDVSGKGTAWLQRVVDAYREEAARIVNP